MRAAANGEKKGEDPPPSGAHPQRTEGAQGGPLNTTAQDPTVRPGPGRRRGPQLQQRAQPARGKDGEGERLHAPTACRLRPEEGGDSPKHQPALPSYGMPSREGGDYPNQEEEEGETPKQRALPAHGMQGRGGGEPEEATGGLPEQRAFPAHGMQERDGGRVDQATGEGTPTEQRALPAHGMQERGVEGGGNPQPKEEGGTPPEQARTPFMRGLIQEMGGNPQDLSNPPSPPQDEAKGRGSEGMPKEAPGSEGAHQTH